MDISDKIISLQTQIDLLTLERNALQDEYFEKNNKEKLNSLIGKCFIYKNCFSCPQGPEDYWDLYYCVDEVDLKERRLIASYFEKEKSDKNNYKIVFGRDSFNICFFDSCLSISKDLFDEQKNKLIQEI